MSGVDRLIRLSSQFIPVSYGDYCDTELRYGFVFKGVLHFELSAV